MELKNNITKKMNKLQKIVRHTFLAAITALLLTTSCSLTRLAKLGKQVEVLRVEKVEFKGLTGLVVAVEIRNDSPLDITMNDGVIKLFIDDNSIATLVQVGVAESKSKSTHSIKTTWRIENINPISMFALTSLISQNDYSSLSINYSAELSAGSTKRQVADEGVKLARFMSEFKL